MQSLLGVFFHVFTGLWHPMLQCEFLKDGTSWLLGSVLSWQDMQESSVWQVLQLSLDHLACKPCVLFDHVSVWLRGWVSSWQIMHSDFSTWQE
jgi:hypothetical protein